MSRFRHTSLPLALLLGAFFAALYLLTGSSDLLQNGDTELRYQTTQAIVDYHRLWIAHPAFTDSRVSLGLGHRLYAFYGPGQIALMIPLYIAGKFVAHHLALPYGVTTLYAARSLDLFLGAALDVLFFAFVLAAGYSRRIAVALTLIFGAATVVWPDAQSALEQTPVDLFLLLAAGSVWLLVKGGMSKRKWLLSAGIGVGLATATRYDAALYIPLFALFVAAVRWQHGQVNRILADWIAYACGALPFLAAVGLWDRLRFGSPFLTGLHEQTLGNPTWLGIPELLVSPGKGLVWYLPLVLLLPLSARRFWARDPRLAPLCAILVLLPLLFYASVLYWHGDPSWGPRYLYVAVPYLILPLGSVLDSWPTWRHSTRALIVVVIVASLGVQMAAVSVTPWRFWYRLQVAQQRTAHANSWTGQPFRWGSQHYHYYWNIGQSPILIQFDDVYQVSRIALGDNRYRLTSKADPYTSSNPAALYPVNSFTFWWANDQNPLLGPHTRDGIVIVLLAVLLASGVILGLELRLPPPGEVRAPSELSLPTTRTANA